MWEAIPCAVPRESIYLVAAMAEAERRPRYVLRFFRIMPTYRVRFRFRVLTKLNITTHQHEMKVGARVVVLSSLDEVSTIAQSEWLVMNACGFESEEVARDFGATLKSAVAVAASGTRLGVDIGDDKATSVFSEQVKRARFENSGVHLRSSVHGLDVFVEDGSVRFPQFHASLSVLAKHEEFLDLTAQLHETQLTLSDNAREIVLLLNSALMQPEPIAQVVLAFSAVEALGQKEQQWSDNQKSMKAECLTFVKTHESDIDETEREEVLEAIEKLHRVSLRQGVLRLLKRLGLNDLKNEWHRLYGERSTLVHGLAPKPGQRYDAFANQVITLCGHILLRALKNELPEASRASWSKYLFERYPVQKQSQN
jgi:hypothetical protein